MKYYILIILAFLINCDPPLTDEQEVACRNETKGRLIDYFQCKNYILCKQHGGSKKECLKYEIEKESCIGRQSINNADSSTFQPRGIPNYSPVPGVQVPGGVLR